MVNQHEITIAELIKLLKGGSAHVSLYDAVKDLPAEARHLKPADLPYSIWQLVEHIRIAQWDMLEFSRDSQHQSPKWPEAYWPVEASPANEAAWQNSIKQITDDLSTFIDLLKNEDIYALIPHGDGQSILSEALQIADHNAYHISEIVLIRRLLGNWLK